MKIEILEYKINKGDKVKVQSHKCHKGKWKSNPNWEWHNKVARGETTIMFGIDNKFTKRYWKEFK
jgi:hypothetical protein